MKFSIISDFEHTPGNLIRQLRLNRGYTIVELAKLAGCSRSAISRWEHGNRVPPTNAFIRIMYVLDCEVIVMLKERRGDEANPASKEV